MSARYLISPCSGHGLLNCSKWDIASTEDPMSRDLSCRRIEGLRVEGVGVYDLGLKGLMIREGFSWTVTESR